MFIIACDDIFGAYTHTRKRYLPLTMRLTLFMQPLYYTHGKNFDR
jgi:hypothetical protein